MLSILEYSDVGRPHEHGRRKAGETSGGSLLEIEAAGYEVIRDPKGIFSFLRKYADMRVRLDHLFYDASFVRVEV
jgi:hypothetical protein